MSGWTFWHIRQWRRLFGRNAREGFDRKPTAPEYAAADALREMGWSPHRAAGEVYKAGVKA